MKRFLRKILGKNKTQYYDICGDNNKLIIIENGVERLANKETILGLWVSIHGNNNTVKLELPIHFENSSIIISDSDEADIFIRKTQHHVKNFSVNSRLHSGHKLFIDEDFYCNGATILLREENASVKIGKDCMFSWGITIWTSDGHCIFDNTTGELLNDPSGGGGGLIGNHVWVGCNVNLLKNSKIPDNSVVALGAIISKRFDEENILLVGTNEVKKRNIRWTRDFITDYKRSKCESINRF